MHKSHTDYLTNPEKTFFLTAWSDEVEDNQNIKPKKFNCPKHYSN